MQDGCCIRELVLNSDRPIVLNGLIDHWPQLLWTLSDWESLFGNDTFVFHKGKRCCSEYPAFEYFTVSKILQFSDYSNFANDRKELSNDWLYFAYKNIGTTFPNTFGLLNSKLWETLGIEELTSEDSYLWMGTVGANTPCHYDTYGHNIVAQVSGTKRWFLFPPSENHAMQPTRVPYEESTVFSKINFACKRNLIDIEFQNSYCIDLNPGEILYVPPRWWHYAQNLTNAVSLNVWIPNVDDDKWRLREALVRNFVFNIADGVDTEQQEIILNQNEIFMNDYPSRISLIKNCVKRCKGERLRDELLKSAPEYSLVKMEEAAAHTHKYYFPKPVTNDILRNKISCYCEDKPKKRKIIKDLCFEEKLINSICRLDIINSIMDDLLNSDEISSSL